jgi:hypothetical protein
MKKKITKSQKHSLQYDFLVQDGVDESVAAELEDRMKQKERRKKRLELKNKKEDKWS